MYTKKMINEWLAVKGTKYVFVIGYDTDNDYMDVMLQWSDNLPTMEQMDLFMGIYKPLEIRGAARDKIWCDAFDKGGKIDLPEWFHNGQVEHFYTMEELEQQNAN